MMDGLTDGAARVIRYASESPPELGTALEVAEGVL